MKKRSLPTIGCCKLCGKEFKGTTITSHLEKCRNSLIKDGEKKPVKLMHILVKSVDQPQYWLQIAVWGGEKLSRLDDFLRSTWLECCGHLSAFKIDGVKYESSPDPHPMFGSPAKSMNVKLNKVLTLGSVFDYTYDFGSSTKLQLEVLDTFQGSILRDKITLLAHNKKPTYKCTSCDTKPAVYWCTECVYDGIILCHDCAPEHECGEDYLSPIVNSPRTGVCGYCGPVPFDEDYLDDFFEIAAPPTIYQEELTNGEKWKIIDIIQNTPELANQPFTAQEALKSVLNKAGKEFQLHETDVKDLLIAEPDFAILPPIHGDSIRFTYLQTAFKEASFPVTPSEKEVEQGILIPGDKFLPFISIATIPFKAVLMYEKEKVATRKVAIPFLESIQYLSLLGEENAFVYNTLDDPDALNRFFDGSAEPISLTAFDLKDFYKKNNFKLGDSMLMKVEDFNKGIIEIEYLSKSERDSRKGDVLRWSAKFSEGLDYLINEYGVTLSIEKQIASALLFDESEPLCYEPVMSISDFLKLSPKYELIDLDGETMIWDGRELPDYEDDDFDWDDEDDFDFDFDEDFDIFEDDDEDDDDFVDLDSIDGILNDLKLPYSEIFVNAIILEALYQGNNSFDDLWNKWFEFLNEEHFENDQELINSLKNLIKKRIDELSESYDPKADADIAPIRQAVIALKNDTINHIEKLVPLMVTIKNPDDFPKHGLSNSVEITLDIDDLLDDLNECTNGLCDIYRLNEYSKIYTQLKKRLKKEQKKLK